jgi:hypothetical protein
MLTELRSLRPGSGEARSPQALAGIGSPVVAGGFVFREVARVARHVLPAPVANAAVAAAGTWVVAEAYRRFGDRLP